MMQKLAENGVSRSDIEACFMDIPVEKEMKQAVHELTAASIPVVIVSDANTFFIECILKVC